MDALPVHCVVIKLILKGGPPWGFRIKQRVNRVVVSKVNCGGRAAKVGLQVNDEIIGVNNLDIEKHPLTLGSALNSENLVIVAEPPIQLTKLDFTYQLIKHTLSRQLHLTIRRCLIQWPPRNRLTAGDEEEEEEEESVIDVGPGAASACAGLPAPSSGGIVVGNRVGPVICTAAPESESEGVSSPTSSSLQSLYDSARRRSSFAFDVRHFSPLLVRTCSDDSMNSGPMLAPPIFPSFRARAPKNIWSPGSTTTSFGSDASLDRSSHAAAKVWSPGSSSIGSDAATVLRNTQAAGERVVLQKASDKKESASISSSDHDKTCVFSSLTSSSGRESDDSYVMRKREPSVSEPASRSTYIAVQKGDSDIPISGLQRPAPPPQAHKDSPHRFREHEVNIHYLSPVRQLLDETAELEEFVKQFQQTLNGPRGLAAERSGSRTRSVSRERDLSRHHFTPSQEAVVHLNRYQRAFAEKADQSAHQAQHVQLARVMFDFHALSAREISVQKNDTVILRKQVDANWFEIEDPGSGLRGIVPRNYLDADQDGSAVVKFDFDAKSPLELPFRKGDRLKLIRKVDDNWYEGRHEERNQIGIFPCSYVDTIKQPITLQLNNNAYPRSSSLMLSNGHRASTSTTGTWRPKSTPPFSSTLRAVAPPQPGNQYATMVRRVPVQPKAVPPEAVLSSSGASGGAAGSSISSISSSSQASAKPRGPTPSLASGGASSSSGGSKGSLYRVIYPYKPQQSDELPLTMGDILNVTMQCDDGWFVGQSTLTGEYGTFPGNYVQPMN